MRLTADRLGLCKVVTLSSVGNLGGELPTGSKQLRFHIPSFSGCTSCAWLKQLECFHWNAVMISLVGNEEIRLVAWWDMALIQENVCNQQVNSSRVPIPAFKQQIINQSECQLVICQQESNLLIMEKLSQMIKGEIWNDNLQNWIEQCTKFWIDKIIFF